MFAQAEWFTKGSRVGRVRPSTWRGRFYMIGWMIGLVAPALLLFSMYRVPEAGVWLLLATAAWWLDLRPVRSSVWRGRAADLFVIDENTDITQLNTKNYDMSLRG